MATIDVTQTGIGVGLAVVILLVIGRIVVHRALDSSMIAYGTTCFLSASNIPAGIFMAAYGFDPDPPDLHSKLAGMEKFISMGGIALTLAAVVGLWSAFTWALKK